MRDFQYQAVLGGINNWGWLLKDFDSHCLRRVASAFQCNLIRTSTLALMPSVIAFEATREQLWIDQARVKAGEELDPELSAHPPEDVSHQVTEEFGRLLLGHRKSRDDQIRKLRHAIGSFYLERLLFHRESLAVGIEAIFSSIVLDSWTAFECLASDLWVATLDNDKGRIASRLQLSDELKASKDVTAKARTSNIKTRFGSFCLETRRASFQTLEGIERLYAITFGQDVRDLFETTEDEQPNYITALFAVRDILTHKRGKVDNSFLKQVAPFPELSDSPENKELKLDGAIVGKMRNAAMVLGRQLIQVADRALVAQKAA